MSNILDGRKISKEIKNELAEEIKNFAKKPRLVVVSVGEDPASKIYVGMKEKSALKVGMDFGHLAFSEDTDEEEIIKSIECLNEDNNVNGIIIQLPLPKHFHEQKLLNTVLETKDVDGLSECNMGRLFNGKPNFIPCTPFGVITLLNRYNINIKGKTVTIIGRSKLVGKPLATLFLKENATVTICHSKTDDLKKHTQDADIVVVATGKPNLLNGDMVKEGVIVIDVGINRVDNKIVGDVNFDEVSKKASFITPVPGGVGPLTVAMLLHNTVEAYKKIQEI